MIKRCLILLLVMLGGLAPVIAADPGEGYQLGAQDKISVTVLKHPELSGTYTVPPDGLIDFPRVGQVNVIGKTTGRLAAIIIDGLRKILVDPDVSVVLAEPRLRNAYVIGSVAKPGQYTLGKGARITELVAAAGDLTGDRERLTASLVRGKETIKVDLQKAMAGDPEANLVLQEGDVLWVQAPVLMTVVVAGPVKLPGPLKVEKGSRVLDAVAKAGDLVGSRERMTAKILRGTTEIPVKLQAALTGDRDANLPLEDGDTLVIQAPPQITVTVMGQVKNPGMVRLDEGSTLVNAITSAGDVTERPERVRVKLIHTGQVKDVKYGDNTVIVRDGDVVSIERETMVRVYVSGHVKNPGAYDIVEGSGSWAAITMAGGTLATPALSKVTIKRGSQTVRQLNLARVAMGEVTEDPPLQNGDEVIVPESTARIAVLGAVARAGVFPVSETEPTTIVEAITLAGGALREAKLDQVVLIRDIDPKMQKATRIKVNVNDIVGKGKVEKNLELQPNDVVYVPMGTKFEPMDIIRTGILLLSIL